MASLQHRHGSYRVIFRYQAKQHSFTLGEVSNDEAQAKAAQVEYLLMRLKQRLATLPAGVGIVEYLQFDGNPPAPVPQGVSQPPTPPQALTLGQLRDRYLATHRASLEENTVATIELHFRHLASHFGARFPIVELSLADLQGYVDHRAKAKGIRRRKLSAVTIEKEIVSLQVAWNWGAIMKLVTGPFPEKGLRYPKTVEKPPFQSLAEVEQRIKAGGLTPAEQADLFDSLYLQICELKDFLNHVKAHARHGFIFPMACLAAHTGARRSELLRLRIADVDFANKIITIHERKRVKGKATTRRVPMSAFLADVLKEWLAIHPGGPWLFCHAASVRYSNKRSATTGYSGGVMRPKSKKARQAAIRPREPVALARLTEGEAHCHLKATLKNSRWQVVRGWHVLRHSFISACASRGVDQRLVETWAGHMSPDMSRRYAHLYPSVQQEALARVFEAA
jgi:integrase